MSPASLNHKSFTSAAVPPELIAAVHAVAVEPALARFCHLCCCLRTSDGRVSQFLRSLDAPPADLPSLTPCGRRASCRAPATVSTLAEDPPGDIPDPAAPPPPSISLRPSPEEILENTVRACDFWTDLYPQARREVSRLLVHLLRRIRDTRGEDAIAADYADWNMMPAAVLHRILPGEPGAGSRSRQCAARTERLCRAQAGAAAGDGIPELWREAQVAAHNYRERQATAGPHAVELPEERRKRHAQRRVEQHCCQGQYRRGMRLLDRKPLLDLSIPANMQKICELHPDAERPVTPIAVAKPAACPDSLT
jgi:hypothetical protein